MSEIAALTLTDAERLSILTYWPTPESFIAWQRDVLAAEIERRAAEIGRQSANVAAHEAVEAAREVFPTVFGEQ